MAEIKTITLTHKEVAEALIKFQKIHEGIWQLYVEFGISAGNIVFGPNDTSPAAIVPIKKLGLMKTDEKDSPLAVDASVVNPKPNGTKTISDKDADGNPLPKA